MKKTPPKYNNCSAYIGLINYFLLNSHLVLRVGGGGQGQGHCSFQAVKLVLNQRVQYCAKLMQANCVNFVLCSRELSSLKVRA